MTERVLLDHGEGGGATDRLVHEVFLAHLGAPEVLEDAAEVRGAERVAVTTDGFVVRPRFFPGGDIGRLAVAGTVNDLAVSGAEPRYLTASFVIEEGLRVAELERVAASMAAAAGEAGVRVVAGDTKVVGRGEADGLFITTTGIGWIPGTRRLSAAACRAGDAVLVSGPVGDHGTAVLVAREGFDLSGLASDCQPLADLAEALLAAAPGTRCMRDPTRGGLATTLVELAEASGVSILLQEETIPVRPTVRAACDLLGLDPLYAACEGRLVAVVPAAQAAAALRALGEHPRGVGAAEVGRVGEGRAGVALATTVGGTRPIFRLEGAQLPRIC